ncbi:MAG: 16S rRNA (guanine(966)-N(2))-methyltransferase RsmD [Chloroflexi bacterium GWC2_73_18]|nr:MAG: 16S rRNA (guanine(966)-N(2))-methyltransferase RsmD [Chloroflexi bacterium GWC2_73_18]
MPDAGRVVAGRAGGIRLAAPGPGTRPLADRVKQALFGALEPRIVGARVADLFAGSGAAGIEALSRGAASCDFVERDAGAAAAIVENLRRTGLGGASARIHRADVLRFLAGSSPGSAPWGIVIVDPPYGDPAMLAALERLARGPLLAPEAIVVAKHFWKQGPPAVIGRLRQVRTRRFGETAITFFEVVDGEAARA